jgi:hypothetical protein
MANVEQMLNNLAEYWTKSLENIGVCWTKIGKIWGKKLRKNFEKNIGKIF